MATLRTYGSPALIELDAALVVFGAAAPGEAIGLVYAPAWCGFARLVGGRLVRPRATERREETLPADAYEVRVFTPAAELRWLKNPAGTGTGTAAIITERDLAVPGGWTPTERECERNEKSSPYLLWGRLTDNHPATGWGEVAEARVGGIPVPDANREFSPNGRVQLCVMEYITADEFGSAFVCEERLTELEVQHAQG